MLQCMTNFMSRYHDSGEATPGHIIVTQPDRVCQRIIMITTISGFKAYKAQLQLLDQMPSKFSAITRKIFTWRTISL